MKKEKRKRPIPLSDWIPKIMKYFPKSETTQTCYITHTQKKKKEKRKKRKKENKTEIMNRKGIEESNRKQEGGMKIH